MVDIFEKLKSAGVYEYGVVDTRDVEFREDVRAMCAEDKCHKYGKSWACPPAIGTVDECRDRTQGTRWATGSKTTGNALS